MASLDKHITVAITSNQLRNYEEVIIETPQGKIAYKLTPQLNINKTYRCKHKGYQNDNSYGDLYIHFELINNTHTTFETQNNFNKSPNNTFVESIFEACKTENYAEVKRLIDLGADVNCQNDYGETPLFYCREVKIAELLIQHGADVNAVSDTSKLVEERCVTPIFNCIYRLLFDDSFKGRTPQNEQREVKLIDLFINHGADVNHRNSCGNTPLIYAVKNNYMELTKILLLHSADVNMRCENYTTALFVCKNIEFVTLLVRCGADVTVRNNNGYTLLHGSQDYQISEFYLKCGLDVNDNNNIYRDTPLHGCDNDEIIKLYLKHGADPFIKNKDGFSPYELCLNPTTKKIFHTYYKGK